MELDVAYDKIIDWLCSRRKIPVEWPTILKGLHKKTQQALDDYTDCTNPKIQKLLQEHPAPTFQTAMEVYRHICESSEGEKNLIGFHTRPRAKVWCALVQNYKKRNIYLCDFAKDLVQMVRYDWSSAKKQIQQYTKQITDLDRRKQENERQ